MQPVGMSPGTAKQQGNDPCIMAWMGAGPHLTSQVGKNPHMTKQTLATVASTAAPPLRRGASSSGTLPTTMLARHLAE